MTITKIKNPAIQALEEKKFFKLVCGASFTDISMIEKLVFIFTLAGADVIDLAPRADVIFAARKGIEKAGASRDLPLLMASIQLDKDPHFRKVEVDYDTCDLCGVCVKVCPTEAFVIASPERAKQSRSDLSKFDRDCFVGQSPPCNDKEFKYYIERCYGCNLCPKYCHVNALTMKETIPTPFETLNEMILLGVDAIEFHFGKNYEAVADLLGRTKEIKNLIKGLNLVSFSIGSELLLEEEILKAAILCYKSSGKGIILQCDGKPMSGGFKKNGNNSDSSSIKVAKVIQKLNLPVYLQLSGGTDEYTYARAVEAGIEVNGVAIGSYARKLLMPFLNNNDIFTNKSTLKPALDIARKLVASVKSQGKDFL